jgi:hypothetical protein
MGTWFSSFKRSTSARDLAICGESGLSSVQSIYIDSFHTQKAGNTASEYEDAFWTSAPTAGLREGEKPVRIAIADGATDSMFSGLWARLLVRAYGKKGMTAETAQNVLTEAAKVWDRAISRRPLPWYAEEKARNGAYAALVGFEFSRGGDLDSGNWSALACGDSCFFHLRSGALIESFPIARSEEFSSTPLLLGSHPRMRGLEGIRTAAGTWQEGDCFYLMSDALASWFLTCCEAGDVPWRSLRNVTIAKEPSFEDWTSSLRRKRAIKNDDCTLIGISFEHCGDER